MTKKPARIAEIVTALAEPAIEAQGLELVDVTFRKEGSNFILRIFIDKPEGITVEDCEIVSKRVGAILDETDPIEPSYYLEVSSPGLERELKRDQDFVRFIGRQVSIHTYAPIDNRRKFAGTLGGIVEDKIQLDMEAGESVFIPRANVSVVKLVAEIDWEGQK